jgi:hypothetical protein
VKLLAFCEAGADFRIASELVDRVLRELSPLWVRDVLDSAPDAIRSWRADGAGRHFFDIHRIKDYGREMGVHAHGHFDGKRGNAGALMARTAFLIARELRKRDADLVAVVLVWDMDDEPKARREGLEQARADARAWAAFQIVLGCPNPMREAWVLAGFDPTNDDEQQRLATARQELGFWPNEEAQRLDSNNEQAKLSAKRVLRLLTDGYADREADCWQETDLETLRARGEHNGLRDFLREVADVIVPLCAAPADGR